MSFDSEARVQMDGCPCGQSHSFSAANGEYVRKQIALRGPNVIVTTVEGRWSVPRLFIAAHGLKAAELPELAERYGFIPWMRAGRAT